MRSISHTNNLTLFCVLRRRESTLIYYEEEGINFILAFFVMSYPDCLPLKHDVPRSLLCGISNVSHIIIIYIIHTMVQQFVKHVSDWGM